MIGAIGSSSAYAAQSPASTAGLEAQLSRCRQQLSEAVNCASYNTREGKNKAQAISNRIGELEGRIEQIRNNSAQTKDINSAENLPANEKTLASSTQDAVTGTIDSGVLGTRLNVYA
ncbi:MAG: FlxA-like family protein [Gammaproteobacteria bacterium]|nr:FlxA-like family protein [Gammaproteobacteria bacterium]MBU1625343.1 FlxA-like family protein [Gammaproteobacteria bacterium]MBU1981603.1 FlxA-like family protein [Gammaproteobacteria bacterium]